MCVCVWENIDGSSWNTIKYFPFNATLLDQNVHKFYCETLDVNHFRIIQEFLSFDFFFLINPHLLTPTLLFYKQGGSRKNSHFLFIFNRFNSTFYSRYFPYSWLYNFYRVAKLDTIWKLQDPIILGFQLLLLSSETWKYNQFKITFLFF